MKQKLTVLGRKILLSEALEKDPSIIKSTMMRHWYIVDFCGPEVKTKDLVGKKVEFIKGIPKDFNDRSYWIVEEEDLLPVIEE